MDRALDRFADATLARVEEAQFRRSQEALARFYDMRASAVERIYERINERQTQQLAKIAERLQTLPRPPQQPVDVLEVLSDLTRNAFEAAPALQLSASGTVTSSGSAELEVVNFPSSRWTREQTRLFMQFYVSLLALVLLGSLADRFPDQFDSVTMWTGGGVWPAAPLMWALTGKAFDRLYPAPAGEEEDRDS